MHKTIGFWRGRLPHWEVEDGKYFVTIRLKGAIPEEGRRQLREKIDQLRMVSSKEDDEFLRKQRIVFQHMEGWLHRSNDVTFLKNQQVAEMVMEAIEQRQMKCVWNMFEYVIMPNHVHLFFETGDGHIKDVMVNFKRWTGNQANKMLRRTGRFWQIEWFDHWSRSDGESEKIVRYIRDNPRVAGLVTGDEKWPYAGHGDLLSQLRPK